MALFESNFIFTAPIRKFKANDPYYWEVDNIPISELEQNTLFLKDQLEKLVTTQEFLSATGGGITRDAFSDLRPTVAGSVVSVEPGRFTARINDAATLTEALSNPALNAGEGYLGEGSSWFMQDPVAVRSAVDKIISTDSANALFLNGLFEKLSTYPVYKVALGQYVNTGSTVTTTDLGDNLSWTGFPLLSNEKVYDLLSTIFNQSLNKISFAQPLAKEFTKRWRGAIRTAVVDVPETLTITVPEFDPEDYFYFDSTGTKQLLGSNTERIDLIFIYSKPVDQGSSKVISNGGVTTITKPSLGILVGAGLGLDYTATGTDEYATIVRNTDSGTTGDFFMLASQADVASTDGGILLKDGTTVNGSFPAPDDILNLAPLLANDLATNDLRLVGQSILPIAYVRVTQAQAGVITRNDLMDIRPFFRTTELTYDERAGIAAALPGLSLANPAVGKRELDDCINTVVTTALGTGGTLDNTNPSVPRTIGGGYIWGGRKYGPEGAITAAMGDNGSWFENGTFGMSYTDTPSDPDWDWATWTSYLDGTKDGAGVHKNDWINFKYVINRNLSTDSTLDFEEVGASNDDSIFTNSFGTDIGKGINTNDDGLPNPLMMYWVKKRFWFTLPSGFANYSVKASLINCAPLSQTGLSNATNRSFQSAGTQGIWVSKGDGWFDIYVGWVGPDPYKSTGGRWGGWSTDSTKAASFPSSNRDSNKFRSWTCLYPELGVVPVADGSDANATIGTEDVGYVPHLDSNPEVKVDSVGVCTYPSVVFEVTGFPIGWENNGFLLYNSTMPHNGTTQLVLR